jgi:hypothetical protein
MKTCSKCKIEKELIFFSRRKDTGYRSYCKQCEKEYNKEYNKKNKNLVKIQKIKYREENKEEIKKKRKTHYENNKEFIKDYTKNYYHKNKNNRDVDFHKNHWIKHKEKITKKRKERKIKNPLLKLSITIRTLLSNSIKRMGYAKSSKTNEILGCSFEEFKLYIESQFQDGMSWENHGEWHLDHKIPISWADSEEKVYELNHYLNFQPLWAFDNLSKGNKWSD